MLVLARRRHRRGRRLPDAPYVAGLVIAESVCARSCCCKNNILGGEYEEEHRPLHD